MFARTRLRRRKSPVRRGGAAVELALCLPILSTFAFGMLEYNNVVMLKTRMASAAYESCRLATRPTTSEADAATAAAVTTYANALLTQLGVNGATVTMNPTSLSAVVPQNLVTVTITAPLSQNSLTNIVLSSSTVVTATASLIVE